uniref:Uncharacterized protein n=1 Tax=Parascaris univalens TaxID=6257 RepID=A0A915CJ37_PARUN
MVNLEASKVSLNQNQLKGFLNRLLLRRSIDLNFPIQFDKPKKMIDNVALIYRKIILESVQMHL